MNNISINWKPSTYGEVVIDLPDFVVHFTSELQFDTPIKGNPGYVLFYKPNQIRQAEGVDIVAAVAQAFREQHILNRVKTLPQILSADPAEQSLEGFFGEAETPGGKAN